MANQDNYGYFGPNYSYADAVPLPGSIGVRQDPSVGAIIDSVAGINTYIDVIAFGGPTFFDQANPQPMGIRYFMNTGTRCSNGATMSQYVDNVTKGDALGASVQTAMASAGLPGLRGLAPGMVENAINALDPRPIISAVTGTGYPVCQQVMCPVGDIQGRVTNPDDGSPVILGDLNYIESVPHQTRWVQALDSTGSNINVSQSEFAAQAKCYNADGTYNTTAPPNGCAPAEAAAQNIQGTGPYANCIVTQPATLPPTLAPSTSESFVGGVSNNEAVGIAIAVGILGGIALWSMRR
jgi:hypothetical protein